MTGKSWFKPAWKQRYLHGWRCTTLIGLILTGTVFIVNLTITIVSTATGDGFRKIFYSGNCGKAQNLDFILHLYINGLSTIILGASNFAMQVLSGPTRSEIDAAHKRSKWLDIGVLSIRNMSWIRRTRVMLWSILLLSSFPLHLL